MASTLPVASAATAGRFVSVPAAPAHPRTAVPRPQLSNRNRKTPPTFRGHSAELCKPACARAPLAVFLAVTATAALRLRRRIARVKSRSPRAAVAVFGVAIVAGPNVVGENAAVRRVATGAGRDRGWAGQASTETPSPPNVLWFWAGGWADGGQGAVNDGQCAHMGGKLGGRSPLLRVWIRRGAWRSGIWAKPSAGGCRRCR